MVFSGVLPKNIWSSRLHLSNSIRTKKYDDIFKLKPNYSKFRQNPKSIAYNADLFKSPKDSLDIALNRDNKVVPFVHSNK